MVDLFLISSWVNSSIIQSILTGLLLSLSLIWGWWLRNHLWQQSSWHRLEPVFTRLVQQDFEFQPRTLRPQWCAFRQSDGRMLSWKLGFFEEYSVCSISGKIGWIGTTEDLVEHLELSESSAVEHLEADALQV